jgi:hypothetical protein
MAQGLAWIVYLWVDKVACMYLLMALVITLLSLGLGAQLWYVVDQWSAGVFAYCKRQEQDWLVEGLINYGIARFFADKQAIIAAIEQQGSFAANSFACPPYDSHTPLQGIITYCKHSQKDGAYVLHVVLHDHHHTRVQREVTIMI